MEWIYFITGFCCSLMMFAIPSYYRGKRLMAELEKTKLHGHIGSVFHHVVMKEDGKAYYQKILFHYNSPANATFEEQLAFERENEPIAIVLGETPTTLFPNTASREGVNIH